MQSQNLALEHAHNYHLNSLLLKNFSKMTCCRCSTTLTLHYHYSFVIDWLALHLIVESGIE